MSTQSKASSFLSGLPSKAKQDGMKKGKEGINPPKNPPKEKPSIQEQDNSVNNAKIVNRFPFNITRGDEIEINRIEDYLREQGIRGLDRTKLVRFALRLACKDLKKTNLQVLQADVLSLDGRIKT